MFYRIICFIKLKYNTIVYLFLENKIYIPFVIANFFFWSTQFWRFLFIFFPPWSSSSFFILYFNKFSFPLFVFYLKFFFLVLLWPNSCLFLYSTLQGTLLILAIFLKKILFIPIWFKLSFILVFHKFGVSLFKKFSFRIWHG